MFRPLDFMRVACLLLEAALALLWLQVRLFSAAMVWVVIFF
jgi:hypothetical protein